MKRPRSPELALALANMSGPGSLTRTVALSLGTGLTLLTTVSLVDASLTAELKEKLPEKAPSHFFIGIPKNDIADFKSLIEKTAPGARLDTAPMLRGRLVELAGKPVEQIKAPPDAQWVLNGDRGLTFSETLPPDSRIKAGAWWPADYQGEPLVSFEVHLAKELGLKLGDNITVNVLGRNVSARIANLRTVEWGTLGINFVMIFSPNTLAAAPYTYLGTLNWPEGSQQTGNGGRGAEEGDVIRAVAQAYPTVTALRVRDVISAVNSVLERVMAAIRIAGSVTLIMGAIVLAGALITAQQRRIYEAVVLKTLGATRLRIMLSHLAEHLLLALSLSVLAGALSIVTACLLTTKIMDLSFSLSVKALLQPSILATIFLIALGAAGTFRILSVKPAYYLRSE
jgi:putative ABC transport system permease protein